MCSSSFFIFIVGVSSVMGYESRSMLMEVICLARDRDLNPLEWLVNSTLMVLDCKLTWSLGAWNLKQVGLATMAAQHGPQ